MPASRRPSLRSEPPAGDRRWLIAAAVLALAGLATLVWALWPREDKLGDLTTLQRELLAANGKPKSADIRRIIATADRMSREELRSAYQAAFDQWQGIREQAIDESLAASGAERQLLLDAYLDRMLAFGELLQAMNPGATPDGGRFFPGGRRNSPRTSSEGASSPEGSAPDPAAVQAEKARRQMAARFDEFVATRAKERGIELPRPRR
jgi:hypothetical protein